MAWAKWLSSGETALVAVNFGKRAAALALPLDGLLAHDHALVRDVWSGQRRSQRGPLRLRLPANGGHMLLLLQAQEATNVTADVEWAPPPAWDLAMPPACKLSRASLGA